MKLTIRFFLTSALLAISLSVHAEQQSCEPSSPYYYAFETRWHFQCPRAVVWDVLKNPETWPDFWKDLKSAHVLVADPLTTEWAMKAPSGYELRYVTTAYQVIPGELLAAHTSGQLVGEGKWILADGGKGTDMTILWNVCPTRWWMRLMNPALRKFFASNHVKVMANGEKAFRTMLERAGCESR
jgi:hypothetical protein